MSYVFHVFQPELCELPTRANFNASDMVQPPGAPKVRNPCLPAAGRKIGEPIILSDPRYRFRETSLKVGDVITVRMPTRFRETSLQEEKAAYGKWLKERNAELGIR